MKLLGEVVENQNLEEEILKSSERFLSELLENINLASVLNTSYNEKIPIVDYYLIYNKFIIVGKKKIDKRIVRKIGRQDVVEELNLNWYSGLEPNFVLIPVDSKFNFGIYIQDSIYYFERN